VSREGDRNPTADSDAGPTTDRDPGPAPVVEPGERPGAEAATGWLRSLVPGDPRAAGSEPDYRFTLANERTFLAWIRTALALAAGGLGAIALLPDLDGSEPLGLGLLALSFVMSASSYRRWVHNEHAMRLGTPLYASRLPMLIAVGTALFAVAGAVLLVVDTP
jgi:putative membrane protein